MDWIAQYSQWMVENGLEDYPSNYHEGSSKINKSNCITKDDVVILLTPNYKNFSSKNEYEKYLDFYEKNKSKLISIKSVENDIVEMECGFKTSVKNVININDDDLPF